MGLKLESSVLGSKTPWPSVKFGTIRLWDTSTEWADMNSSSGRYDWSHLDSWLSTAQQHGVTSILYTFGGTPSWISSHPTDSTCSYAPGRCDPPRDLNADGSGTDAAWQAFVRALASHSAGRIKYWQMWNTPNDARQWRGTPQQLVRMAKDARAIIRSVDSTALIIGPPTGNYHVKLSYPCYAANIIAKFLAAGGGQYVDVIAFHSYFTDYDRPDTAEDIVPMIQCVVSTMKTYGQSGKPIWTTEGGWGKSTDLSNADAQAAFVARTYLIQRSMGVQRFYWYAWNNLNWGTLWSTSGMRKSGQAYQQVSNWLIGSTITRPCAQSSGIWECGLTLASGKIAQPVWSASSKSYNVPSFFTKYSDLTGATYSVPGSHVITVGPKPYLLF